MTYLKSISVIILLSQLLSCAQTIQKPESVEQKMARYQAEKAKMQKMPQYSLLPMEYRKAQRAPASVEEVKQKKLGNQGKGYGKGNLEKKNIYEGMKNRRVYFLTLYGQYQLFVKLIPNKEFPKIEFCPNFHTQFIEHNSSRGASTPTQLWSNGEEDKTDSYNKKFITQYDVFLKDKSKLPLFPELELPIQLDDLHPNLYDIVSGQHASLTNDQLENYLQQAIEIHIKKTYDELAELCEEGMSENYYVFENLIGMVKEKGAFAENGESMKILLKISLLGNRVLFTALKAHLGDEEEKHLTDPRFEELFENVLERLEANWASKYIKELESQRRNFFHHQDLL